MSVVNHIYGNLLGLYLPLIHRTDQAPQLSNQDRQRVRHSHSHSQLLLPLQKSGRITRVVSPVPTPGAIHSRPVPGSCCHQTEHASTGLQGAILPLVGLHTLPKGEKRDR